MFEIGEFIVYGNNGVCRVDDVGHISLVAGIPKDRIYYTLTPIYQKGSTIYTPVDNERVVMRQVISGIQALELLNELEDIELLNVENEKERESVYNKTLQSCECRDFIKIIKTVYTRMQKRQAEGKKMTNSDRKYFKLAEEGLHGELAVALDIEKNAVSALIAEKTGNEENILTM